MSDNTPGTSLTSEELQAVGGGDCTPQDWIQVLDEMKGAYETLIDLTSYVIERVSGGTPS
jgi:hypothetical protein